MSARRNPPDSNKKSSKVRGPAGHPNRRRGYTSSASQAETRITAPLPKRAFSSTPPRVGQANTQTPNRRSTSGAPYTSSKSNQASYTHQSHQSTTGAPKPQKQTTMDIQLEDELRDTIFHDPKFVDRFLSGDDDKLEAINEHCRANDSRYNDNGQWSVPESVHHENQLYQPVVNMLNKIKKAVDEVHGFPPSLSPQLNDEPAEPEPFIDNHLYSIDSDLANSSKIKPDLVLFQDGHRHWENVRMPVEVKTLPGHHKAGMKQLSRYARAVFAHQLHRRHLYGSIVLDLEQAGSRTRRKSSTATKPREYALKLIWRDPQRDSEGDVLEQVHGMFGLAQYAGHWDVSMPGKCRCLTPTEGRCKDPKCTDKIVEVDGLEVCDKLRDIDVLVPADEEQEVDEVDTTECRATSHVRPLRVYSCVLVASIGIPLWRAESPHQFLTAVLDAMLGYWGLFNLGIMHRDISDGNIMMLSETQEFDRREWKERRKKVLGPQIKVLFESEKKLRAVLGEFGHRDPTGMLSDFDLHAQHSSHSSGADPAEPTFTSGPSTRSTRSTRAQDENTASKQNGAKRRKSNSKRSVPIQQEAPELEEESRKRRVIDYRTVSVLNLLFSYLSANDYIEGTPAFMSARILFLPAGEPYHHSFLDDLQSFFWLIFWSAAAHLDDGQASPTQAAQRVLNSMNQSCLTSMWDWKMGQLSLSTRYPDALMKILDSFGNEWASSSMFQHVIIKLAGYFNEITTKTRPELESSPGDTFSSVVKIIQNALQSES